MILDGMRTLRPSLPHMQPSDTDREDIGAFVRRRRRAAGLTQQALAELSGVGLRFLSELENGKPTLRTDAVNRVLRAFGARLGVVDLPRDEA